MNDGTAIQWWPYCGGQSFRTPRVLTLNPIVNKSCKTKRCGKRMHQIIQDMILSEGLELQLSLLRRTTISGPHTLFHSKPRDSIMF